MKKFSIFFLLAFSLTLAIFLIGGKQVQISQIDPSNQWEYVPNEIIVKFKQGTEKAAVQYAIGAVQGKIKTYLGTDISTLEWDPQAPTLRSFLAEPDALLIKVLNPLELIRQSTFSAKIQMSNTQRKIIMDGSIPQYPMIHIFRNCGP